MAWKARAAGCASDPKWYLLEDCLLSLAGIGAQRSACSVAAKKKAA
jgi:hypothetical protein